MASLPKDPASPEWVTSDALPIRGLDLLGLRIPVERVGQTLLDAVTTISPTIRYVSLRAWIARRYALARLPDSWKSFREFAARIEAAVALGNLLVDRTTSGLVGLDGAAQDRRRDRSHQIGTSGEATRSCGIRWPVRRTENQFFQ